MIVPMAKVYVAARRSDRDRLLDALADLGAVHLAAVDPVRAVPEAETRDALDRTRRALQVLGGEKDSRCRFCAAPLRGPSGKRHRESFSRLGDAPALGPAEAVAETLGIQRQAAEAQANLGALHRRIQALEPWGETRVDQFESLRAAGVLPRFFAVPRRRARDVAGELVHPIRPWPGGRVLVAVVDRSGEAAVPEGSEELPLPSEDRPTLRAEAARIDAALEAGAARLAALARLVPAIRAEQARLQAAADWAVAVKGGLQEPHLYALQGWVPESKAPALAGDLADRRLAAAVQTLEPAPDEQPPTLIRYAWWARPMAGLFQMLGTVPGYREFEVSAAFMIALPIFAAILISDAGYGLLYLLLPVVFYRKMAARGAKELAQLIMVVGVLSMVWGGLTTSFFGYDFAWLLGREAPFVAVNTTTRSLESLMWLSLLIGAIHLSSAHLWKARRNFADLRFLSNLGWALFLWGMYGLLAYLLLRYPFHAVYGYLLIGGGALAVLFAEPSRNVLKTVALGLARFPLSAIGTFGDTVSYVRLMAIGLGGAMLASTFNTMAAELPLYGTIPVLVAGHALNVSLTVVALLAHGVRLNMLEFSNNLGMQWSGYAYEPFSAKLKSGD